MQERKVESEKCEKLFDALRVIPFSNTREWNYPAEKACDAMIQNYDKAVDIFSKEITEAHRKYQLARQDHTVALLVKKFMQIYKAYASGGRVLVCFGHNASDIDHQLSAMISSESFADWQKQNSVACIRQAQDIICKALGQELYWNFLQSVKKWTVSKPAITETEHEIVISPLLSSSPIKPRRYSKKHVFDLSVVTSLPDLGQSVVSVVTFDINKCH